MHSFDPSLFGLGEPLFSRALPDVDATRDLGALAAAALVSGGFLGLIGELGAGKTTLVQGLVGALGGTASSPTYTLLNEYELTPRVYHFDLYRLEDVDDLESVAYWDYVTDPRAISIVEWLDRVPEAWPNGGSVLELQHEAGTRRATLWSTEPHRWQR